eukprot:TRINITY_DN18783_c0_g2_i1.p1 TRINITY_DN18783_c0_g2~~TRINITY_DN18783_c0_g2_i1.p1  ORF type:complete len:286 (-),score=91.36 TRINITY_DN18783_c0_g2_i1:102-959(-)
MASAEPEAAAATGEAEVIEEAETAGDADEDSESEEAGLQGAEEAKEKAKDKGNEEYAKGNYDAAVKAWSRSLQSVKYILDKQFYADGSDQLQEVYAMELRLCLNLSQGHLKLSEWGKAVEMADKALERDVKHSKALYRKATALIQLLSFREAESVVEELLLVEPSNAEAKRMLAEVRRSAQKGQKREKKMAEKMFASSGLEPDPRTPPGAFTTLFDFVTSVPSEVLATVFTFRDSLRDMWRSYYCQCKSELWRRWLLCAHHTRKRLEGMGLLRQRSGSRAAPKSD